MREHSNITIPRIKRSEDLLLLLIGALMRIDVNILGRLAVSELLCIMAIFLFPGKAQRVARQPGAGVFFLLISIWILSVIISDVYNNTALELALRGLARPITIGLLFIAFSALLWDRPKSIIFFFIGLVLSGVQNAMIPMDFRAEDIVNSDSYAYYAFVYTPLLIGGSAFVAWLFYPRLGKMSAVVLLVAGALSFSSFSRTAGSSLILAGLLIMFGHKLGLKGGTRSGERLSLSRALKFTAIGVVIYGLLASYVAIAGAGLIGERAAEKIESQTSRPTDYPILNMFLTGRHYNVVNYLMISDNPIFGSGSWPLTGRYDLMALDIVESNIAPTFFTTMDSRRATGHSIIFGSWANYGPLSVIFWIYILFCTIKFMTQTFNHDRRLFSFVVVYLIVFCFSLFFNNLNSLNRSLAAIVPVLLAAILKDKDAYSLKKTARFDRA